MKKYSILLLMAIQYIDGISQFCIPFDLQFGSGGKSFGVAINSMGAANVIVQPDGKIFQIGSIKQNDYSDFVVIRYKSDGSLDPSFGNSGIAVTSFQNRSDKAVAGILQADGKIVVAGNSDADFALVRLNADGSLDSTFGIEGKTITSLGVGYDEVSSLILQQDGKIIVSGNVWHQCITCVTNEIPAYALVRYQANGNLDSTFGLYGKLLALYGQNSYEFSYSSTTQSDGKLLLASTFNYNCYSDYYGGLYCESALQLTRHNSDGSLDPTFGDHGKVIDESYLWFPSSMAVQKDGKIIVTGRGSESVYNTFIARRYNSDGQPDSSFGSAGLVLIMVSPVDNPGYYARSNAIAITTDNKIVIAGTSGGPNNSQFAVVRIQNSGSLDSSFNKIGIAVFHAGEQNTIDGATGVGIHDSKIIAGGQSYMPFAQIDRLGVVRLNDTAQSPAIAVAPADTVAFCQGGNASLSIVASGDIQWYRNNSPINGATDTVFTATAGGSYTVTVNNSNGCGESYPVIVNVINNPPSPHIVWNTTPPQLNTDSGYSHYQWYFDGNPITGATNHIYEPAQTGLYYVHIENDAGCSNNSAPFSLMILGVSDITVGDTKLRYYPNPTQNTLNIDIADSRSWKLEAQLYDINGRLLQKQSLNRGRNQIYVQHLPAGLYQLVIQNKSAKTAAKLMVVR